MFCFNHHHVYRTPGGNVYNLYLDMAAQPHLLVAGETGSGKSVVINGLIYTLLHKLPSAARFILIDPKRVELSQYRDIPHVVKYASEPEDMLKALEMAMQETETRYKAMQREGVKKFGGSDLYVIIDELADLMTTQKKAVQPIIQRLGQIGRAAKVHLVMATQCPLREILCTPIKCNIDARVGLHTMCAQDSRNILGEKGCELLPRYGQGYYRTPEGVQRYNIPMISEDELQRMVNYWTSAQCIA